MPTSEDDATIEFWYDLASTYSYVAAMRIEHVARAAGLAVRWRPFLLGPIFAAQGWETSPFNIFEAKGRYMWRDMERLCVLEGLAFRRPSQMPRHSLLAARIALVADAEGWCPAFTKAVFRANFAEDRDVTSPDVLAKLLTDMGKPAQAVIERASLPETKSRLREQTDEAMRAGIFGAPTFRVRGELFWGNDRLEQAVAWARNPWL